MLNRLFLLPFLVLAACATTPAERSGTLPAIESPGAVSSADPRATQVGLEILRLGGSASDAAIAMAIALTVVEPQSSGIGGGGFLVHHDSASGSLTSYDGREEAPAAARPDWFLDSDGRPLPFARASIGGRAVGVPGNIRMFALAHGRHGRLSWAQLFAPAIRLARDGFAVTPRMHEMAEGRIEAARLTAWGRGQFFEADGSPRPVGTVIRNPELARLLQSLADHGPDYFYTGPPARALVSAVAATSDRPSPMTLGDLASYDAKERPVPCGTYRGHRICGMGPPSSGATTVFAVLKQLERFDLAGLGPNSPQAWHLIAESMRLAYADRAAYLADPDYVPVPVAGLMDPSYLAQRSRLIAGDRAAAAVAAGVPPGARASAASRSHEVPGTSHMVAVDRRGNVATLTSTIEAPWGSGLTVDGYYLNNELTDFAFVPVQGGLPVPNRIEGGKRPLSSMSPTIVYSPDGQVRLALGAAGGPTIIMQVVKAIIGVIDWRMSAQAAVAQPGMWLRGDTIMVEAGTPLAAMIPELAALGHRVAAAEPPFKANAIERIAGRWIGAADPRSEGAAGTE